jgi:hypothetical protein
MTVTIDMPEWAEQAYQWPGFWWAIAFAAVYAVGFFVARAIARSAANHGNVSDAAAIGLTCWLFSPVVLAVVAGHAVGGVLSRPFRPPEAK